MQLCLYLIVFQYYIIYSYPQYLGQATEHETKLIDRIDMSKTSPTFSPLYIFFHIIWSTLVIVVLKWL